MAVEKINKNNFKLEKVFLFIKKKLNLNYKIRLMAEH